MSAPHVLKVRHASWLAHWHRAAEIAPAMLGRNAEVMSLGLIVREKTSDALGSSNGK
jgi:hypothetical protein